MPEVFVCAGVPFQLITVRSQSWDQLHVRSRWPAAELKWVMTKPCSHQDLVDFGLMWKDSVAYPMIGATNLQHFLFPIDNTGFVISFPSFVASRVQVRSFAKGRGSPPPPPAGEESSWARRRPATSRGHPATKGEGTAPTFRPLPPQLEVVAGEAASEAFQGYQ